MAPTEYMEQLDSPAYQFSAFANDADGRRTEFYVAISAPESRPKGDSFCRVACPFFRKKPFTIYGVDHEQAIELSRRFVELTLEHMNAQLVDAGGNVVELPPVPRAGA
jgi:hypothetical protein